MPPTYRTTEETVAQRLEDHVDIKLIITDLSLFASGAFSNVYKGKLLTSTNRPPVDVVVKKTWPRQKENQLEVNILETLGKLRHKNIIRLLFSYTKKHEGRNCVALIFEYMPLNLYQHLRKNDRRIEMLEIKMIVWQLFRGQAHLQKTNIVHRDIKPQNLLFDADTGLLKITDFGSSSIQSPATLQHSYHVTRYYRPPELLLGSRKYGSEVDVWSCGCVFGELLKGGIFLAGKTAENQAEVIFDALGVPTRSDLEAMNINQSKYQELLNMYEPEAPRRTFNFNYLYEQKPGNRENRKTCVNNTKVNAQEMEEATILLRNILVYKPFSRLSGTELMTNSFFEDIFNPKVVRSNGKKIQCLTATDLQKVRIGDGTVSQESIDGGEKSATN